MHGVLHIFLLYANILWIFIQYYNRISLNIKYRHMHRIQKLHGGSLFMAGKVFYPLTSPQLSIWYTEKCTLA